MKAINNLLVRKTLVKEYQVLADEERKLWAVNVAGDAARIVLFVLIVVAAAIAFTISTLTIRFNVPEAYDRFWIGMQQQEKEEGGPPSSETGPFSAQQVLLASYFPTCYSVLNTLGLYPDGRLVGPRLDGTPARFVEYVATHFEFIPPTSFAPPEGYFSEKGLMARVHLMFPDTTDPSTWDSSYWTASPGDPSPTDTGSASARASSLLWHDDDAFHARETPTPTPETGDVIDVNYHAWVYPNDSCLSSAGLQDLAMGKWQTKEAVAILTLYTKGVCGYAVSATREQWWELRQNIWGTSPLRLHYVDCGAQAVTAGTTNASFVSGVGGMAGGLIGDSLKHLIPGAGFITAISSLVEIGGGVAYGAYKGSQAQSECEERNALLPGESDGGDEAEDAT